MNNNLMAFSDFRDQLIKQKKHSNGDEVFLGRVIYNFNGQLIKETLSITLKLTTFEYGQISIENGQTLNSDIVHMDFNSNFQNYSYNEDGYLFIEGKSNKLGTYSLKIFEV